ncbi:MAG TPA: transferrin-binding protein-like solute binding protein [Sphingomicrobium sp.]
MTTIARSIKLYAASLLITSLAACGGGGSGIGFIPAPPPPPPPPPAGATIGAPATAIMPNASLLPIATIGGPTIQAHTSTVFPLLQTTIFGSTTEVIADAATMSGGATLTFTAPGSTVSLDVENPEVGLLNANLTASPTGLYEAAIGSSANTFLALADPATSNLSWTTYGYWATGGNGISVTTQFVTGYQTPTSSVPTTGSATYLGSTVGESYGPGNAYHNLSGDAALQANFATGAMTGTMNLVSNGFEGDIDPFNSVSLVGTISGGNFGGTTAVTSSPAGALGANATGTFTGLFFGPNAQELGAVWTLFDGTASAVGSIGATTAPGGAGAWDN